jgi:acetoin utilization deacetylase AcuC-like enzyme
MSTGYVYDPIFLEHDLRGHPENARRLVRIHQLLEETGTLERLTRVPVREISPEELAWNHTQRYVDQVRRVAEGGGGHLDMDTYVAPASYEAALRAAGGLIALTAAVLEGEVDNGFGRTPG